MEKKEEILNKYNAMMKGYEPQVFVPNTWPMENGVYKQYSAYEESNNSVSGTSYNH